jgi:hypothetical protein
MHQIACPLELDDLRKDKLKDILSCFLVVGEVWQDSEDLRRLDDDLLGILRRRPLD